jgi:metal-responsive CopG/Arc/MetJ family transcriptional regulator
MKVAVSIPDRISAKADAMAQRLGTSRSALYARALDAFLEREDPDTITAAMNAVVDAIGDDDERDAIVRSGSRVVLARTEW